MASYPEPYSSVVFPVAGICGRQDAEAVLHFAYKSSTVQTVADWIKTVNLCEVPEDEFVDKVDELTNPERWGKA